MATFEVIIPTELIDLAYKKGFEDGFATAIETPDLDKELNLNNISDAEGI